MVRQFRSSLPHIMSKKQELSEYIPDKVWTVPEMEGSMSSMNKPTAVRDLHFT